MSSAVRTARYVRSWLAHRADVFTEELTLDRGGTPIDATLYRPRGADAPLPLWIVLHGMTRPGRAHLQLVRFARALASTRVAVMVPEVPEWVALDLAPDRTEPTVRAALDGAAGLPGVRPGPVGLVGFSFGAPQAIAASGADGIRDRVAGVVAFGGYADLERTVRFQLGGRHEGPEGRFVHRPDPYGRWIVAGNYLTHVPGLEHRTGAAGSLLELAREAGDRMVPSWDLSLDPLKARLASALNDPEERTLFERLVYGPDRELEPGWAEEMAARLTAAGRAVDPCIDATARFGGVRGPVHILHGRNDHLIPFTEAGRLRAALPAAVRTEVTVTRLFGHSAQDPFPWLEGPRESVAFLRALSSMLGLV